MLFNTTLLRESFPRTREFRNRTGAMDARFHGHDKSSNVKRATGGPDTWSGSHKSLYGNSQMCTPLGSLHVGTPLEQNRSVRDPDERPGHPVSRHRGDA